MSNKDFAFYLFPCPDYSKIEVGPDPFVFRDPYTKKVELWDFEVIDWGCGYYDANKGNACEKNSRAYLDGYAYSYQCQQMSGRYANNNTQ